MADEVVAETVRQLGIIGLADNIAVVVEFAVIDELVGVVPAVVELIAERQEVAAGDIAERLFPGQARADAVVPAVVVGILEVVFILVVDKEKLVERG